MTTGTCRNCGRKILVQIQKGTGFCTPRCQEVFNVIDGDPV